VRRGLAISLLLLFSVSLISPLFASDTAASLPACCRRMGKHHCEMSSEAGTQKSVSIGIVAEKCPCTPAVPSAFHLIVFAPPDNGAAFADLVSHPAIHAQTLAQYRISFDRSRQKRGPPILFLL
jgi:hypothetical protein